MTRYANRTEVSETQSKAEIERTIARYGADQFVYGWKEGMAVIGFRVRGRQIKIQVPMPDREDVQFRFTPERRLSRTPKASQEAWQQACKQRWRAVESGITTFETEFLPYTVLPDGRTFAEWAHPQIEAAYNTGRMPALLPGIPK